MDNTSKSGNDIGDSNGTKNQRDKGKSIEVQKGTEKGTESQKGTEKGIENQKDFIS